jgi:hypothetical protein
MIFDPGGRTRILPQVSPRARQNFVDVLAVQRTLLPTPPQNFVSDISDLSEHFTVDLLSVMQDSLPKTKELKSVIMEARITSGADCRYVPKCTLDTGANRGNYIGREALSLLQFPRMFPCRHSARLGDGKTYVTINEGVELKVQIFKEDGTLSEPVEASFFVVETLGEEMIIGLQDLLGSFFEIFAEVLETAANRRLPSAQVDDTLKFFQRLFLDFQTEVEKPFPSNSRLKQLVRQARKKGSSYRNAKQRIRHDKLAERVLLNDGEGNTQACLISERYGCCFEDDCIEEAVNSLEAIFNGKEPAAGEILKPWTHTMDLCPEEELTPDPVSISDDVLHFMEVSVEEARREYLDLLDSHVSTGMKEACPKVMELLRSKQAQKVFAPSCWEGMKVAEVDATIIGELPKRHCPRARPIRRELFETAKEEFERLQKYFYAPSTSPIASPLVIAPKATAPFIRYCGDYREVNKFISIPQEPIPIVQHELTKAAKFKIFVDLDMANSFHQIPISQHFSELLSVQTPWGLVRPKFLPEGVGPASGLLQNLVREIFKDFEEWTVVIFDNFLVLADTHEDAYEKLAKILTRCEEYGIVLKMKKSWIGVETVTFFGYEVTHGSWKLSKTRKDAIDSIPFPANAKEMQSFLGAALFFHNHIPDYSEWTAKLYEMTHQDFVWDRALGPSTTLGSSTSSRRHCAMRALCISLTIRCPGSFGVMLRNMQ